MSLFAELFQSVAKPELQLETESNKQSNKQSNKSTVTARLQADHKALSYQRMLNARDRAIPSSAKGKPWQASHGLMTIRLVPFGFRGDSKIALIQYRLIPNGIIHNPFIGDFWRKLFKTVLDESAIALWAIMLSDISDSEYQSIQDRLNTKQWEHLGHLDVLGEGLKIVARCTEYPRLDRGIREHAIALLRSLGIVSGDCLKSSLIPNRGKSIFLDPILANYLRVEFTNEGDHNYPYSIRYDGRDRHPTELIQPEISIYRPSRQSDRSTVKKLRKKVRQQGAMIDSLGDKVYQQNKKLARLAKYDF
jgi:hypothetical protein